MIDEEANVLLTKAALLDPRMKRLDPVEQADMAIAWSQVLADVTLSDALVALEQHYRSSRDAIMPADVLRLLQVDIAPSSIPDLTEKIGRELALERAGISEAEAAAMPREILAARLDAAKAIEGVEEGWAQAMEVDDE